MIRVHFLPAKGGDFLWLCYRNENHWSHILIDSGYAGCARDYTAVMRHINSAGESVEAVILTHIDNDHIGGFLEWLLQKNIVIPHIKRIFFNNSRDIQRRLNISFPSHPEDSVLGRIPAEKYGVSAAVHILDALEARGLSSVLHGATICSPEPVHLSQGAELLFISPSVSALKRFAAGWEEDLQREQKKTPKYGAVPKCRDSLHKLMDEPFTPDRSTSNGASLAFLFEFEGKRLAFLGDAWAEECLDGLGALGYCRERSCQASLVKLSHHGSHRNFSEELAQTLRAPYFLLSTKPLSYIKGQKITIARLLKQGQPVSIILNCPCSEDFLTPDDRERYIRTKRLRLLLAGQGGLSKIELEEGLTVYGKTGNQFLPYQPI